MMNSHSPQPNDSTPARVIKKLSPQSSGARRWAAAYGDKRVCVRCRVCPQGLHRQSNVETMVDKAPTQNSVQVGPRVAWREKELGRTLRAAGGIWDPNARLWMIALGRAKSLGLADRTVLGWRG